MKYILTPEFHRNVWLKFSAFRMAVAPVFLLLLTVTAINLTSEASSYILIYSLVSIYIVVTVLWGCYEAASAIQEELRTNTWDFQRMSSITPAQLIIGKFLGCTSYVWYFGLLTLGIFVYIFGFYTPPTPVGAFQPLTQTANMHDLFFACLYLLFAGLIGQSLSFLVSLISMTAFAGRTGKYRQPRPGNAFIVGVIAAYMVFSNIAAEVSRDLSEKFGLSHNYTVSVFEKHPVYQWYQWSVSAEVFITASLSFFLFWFLFGSYRIARSELMYGTTPLGWAGFMGTLLVYCIGLTDVQAGSFPTELLGIFALMTFLTYAVMVFEAADTRKYARFIMYLKQGRLMEAFENTHKWVVSVPFMLIVYAYTLSQVPEQGVLGSVATGGLMLSMMMFALRDAFVVHAVFRTGEGRNAAFKIVSYYVMVYLLLPTLHFSTATIKVQVWFWLRNMMRSGIAGDVPEIVKTAAYYFPTPFSDYTLNVLPASLEALVTGGLLFALIRWQNLRNNRSSLEKPAV